MASQPPDDGTGYGPILKDKMQGAGEDFEKRYLTKEPESSYQTFKTGIFSKRKGQGQDDDAEESSDDDISPYPPKAHTAEEQAVYNKRVAEFIDRRCAEDRSRDAAVKYAKNNPFFNPDITSKCEDWIKIRTRYVNELKGNAVKTILDKDKIHLDDVPNNADGTEGNAEGKFKYLQLLPPQTDGPILDIQSENTELYKANLASDRFKGAHDNLATKLAMLHFGLPIEPLTLTNIINADKDQNDEADPAEELPRVQRIIYSEKPLEFLDSYHERSYGYPMLRRPKYTRTVNIPQPQGDAHVPNFDPDNSGLPDLNHAHHHTPLRTPLAPTGSHLNLRGGASQTRILYNHYGGHMKLPVDDQQLVTQGDFLKYLCKLMDTDADSAWTFIFDQYNNTGPYKDTAEKTYVRSFEATKATFPRVYDSDLKAKISNPEEDWILVVQYKYCRAQYEAAPSTFKPPRTDKSDTKGNLPQIRPQNDPSAIHEAQQVMPPPPVKLPIRTLFWYSEASPYVTKKAIFEDSVERLALAVRRLLQKPTGNFTVNISLYTSPPEEATNYDSSKVWYHTEQFPHTSNLQEFNNIVARLANPDTSNHVIVAHPLSVFAPKLWPPAPEPKFAPESAPIYYKNEGRQIKNNYQEFGARALELLNLPADSDWTFEADIYTNEDTNDDVNARVREFAFSITIEKASLERNYSDIQSLLFDPSQNLDIVVRNSANKTPVNNFARFTVPIIEPVVTTTLPPPPPQSTHSGDDDRLTTVPPVQQPIHDGRKTPAIPGRKRPIARPTQMPRFETWIANHEAQNRLQQRSWTQDQSVIEPGYQPAAPIFGDILELPITVGQNLPTVFAQHLTPTDITQILQDKRKAVNHVLEREAACPLCEATFAAYDVETKQAHFAEHNDQLKTVGNCPLCNDVRWRFMTLAQKQEHLLADQSKRESKEIQDFWEATRCPVCNIEFKDLLPDDIMTHIAGHIPGALKYCDRCGLDLLSCTLAEQRHHTRVCLRSTEPAPPLDLICNYCGVQRTAGNQKGHDACGNGTFCIRCGLDRSLLLDAQHDEHGKRCRAPKGPSGKFCKRCGVDLSSLDALGVASHNNECYRREPASVAAARAPDLIDRENAVEKLRLENDKERAEIRAEREELAQRTIAVEIREDDVRAQEIALSIKGGTITPGGQGLNTVDMGECCFPGCLVKLGTMTRRELRDHFYADHAEQVNDHRGQSLGDAFDLGTCPITGCGHVLSQMSRRQLRAHFQTHGGLVSPSVAGSGSNTGAHSFQCPLPLADGSPCQTRIDPRGGGHQIIHHYQHTLVGSGQPCHSEALKNALRSFKDRMPDFRNAHLELERLAQLAQASRWPISPLPERIPTPPHEKQVERVLRLRTNELYEKERQNRIKAAEVKEKETKAAAEGSSDPPPIKTNPLAPINLSLDQIGFRPSPISKRLPYPRKARSVRGRTPAVDNKRKSTMDDSEDMVSGRSSIPRSSPKRDTEMMRVGTESGLSSPNKRQRRIQSTDEGNDSSDFDGEDVNTVSVPKRVTRATSGPLRSSSVGTGGLSVALPRKVGRARKVTQPGDVEGDDGVEDLEEEEDMGPAKNSQLKKGRKNPDKK